MNSTRTGFAPTAATQRATLRPLAVATVAPIGIYANERVTVVHEVGPGAYKCYVHADDDFVVFLGRFLTPVGEGDAA